MHSKKNTHLSLFTTGCLWGLPAPIGKAVMDTDITSLYQKKSQKNTFVLWIKQKTLIFVLSIV